MSAPRHCGALASERGTLALCYASEPGSAGAAVSHSREPVNGLCVTLSLAILIALYLARLRSKRVGDRG